MRDEVSKLLYDAMQEMFDNDPHGEPEEQLQYEYWAGKMHAYADVIQLLDKEQKQ